MKCQRGKCIKKGQEDCSWNVLEGRTVNGVLEDNEASHLNAWIEGGSRQVMVALRLSFIHSTNTIGSIGNVLQLIFPCKVRTSIAPGQHYAYHRAALLIQHFALLDKQSAEF